MLVDFFGFRFSGFGLLLSGFQSRVSGFGSGIWECLDEVFGVEVAAPLGWRRHHIPWDRALLLPRSKVDRLVPHTCDVNLRIVCHALERLQPGP